MPIKQYTAAGEAHGLLDVLTNSVPADDNKHLKGEAKKAIDPAKKEDNRIVRAEYMNKRGNHERLEMPYCKYSGDPIQMWRFIPGYVYDVPYGLVKQVNDKSKHMKKREGLLSVDGQPVRKDEAPLDRDQDGEWLHKFVPVGFAA